MNAPFTAGPWRWEFNAKHKRMHLVGPEPVEVFAIRVGVAL